MKRPKLSAEAAARVLREIALPDIATVDQVAQMLGKSDSSVRALLRAGELPGRKLGNRWYVPRNALLAWLAVLPARPEDDPGKPPKASNRALRLIRGEERLSRRERSS